jgi:hypothetical protein
VRQDEELHAELLRLFRVYFEANQRWINQGTKRAGMDVRAALSDIRQVCSDRRKHIMEWRRWKDVDWAEKTVARRARMAQKREERLKRKGN